MPTRACTSVVMEAPFGRFCVFVVMGLFLLSEMTGSTGWGFWR